MFTDLAAITITELPVRAIFAAGGLTGCVMQHLAPLSGLRILIVEDNALIADHIAHMVIDAGAQIEGPFATVVEALESLDYSTPLDAAVLDISLGAELSYPLAEALKTTGIPFLFLTGKDKSDLPASFAKASYLKKPFNAEMLVQAITNCLK
jgi:DNA-binding response OmpR family regulator